MTLRSRKINKINKKIIKSKIRRSYDQNGGFSFGKTKSKSKVIVKKTV